VKALVLVLLPVLLVGVPCEAGTLASASFRLRGDFGSVAFPGAGATGTATGPGQASLGAGTAFAGTATLTGTGLTMKLELTQNAAGSFGGTPLAGDAAFRGKVSLLSGSFELETLPFTMGEPATTLVDVILPTVGAKLSFGYAAAGWTTGTASFMDLLPSATETATGTNALSPNGAGTVTLVTPLLLVGATQAPDPVFGELQLTYLPEPGAALLLVWGAACLAAAGRRRSRALRPGAPPPVIQ
jgi:hypothetical protein